MKVDMEAVARYYSTKLAEHGATARGVDWSGEEGQELRFAQLIKLCDRPGAFSINDLGCGYGRFYGYVNDRFPDVDYRGFDISPAMIDAARNRHDGVSNAAFFVSPMPKPADFGVASGIFNVRLTAEDAGWQAFIEETLDNLNETSRRGFAFNCLTSYSDAHKQRDYLFYSDPCRLFDWCKRRYSRDVALLHDYGLYEFTIIVRKA